MPIDPKSVEEDHLIKAAAAEQPVLPKKVREPKPEKKHRGQAKKEAQENSGEA